MDNNYNQQGYTNQDLGIIQPNYQDFGTAPTSVARKLPDTFSFDEEQLYSMGFTAQEVQYFANYIDMFGSLTKSKLMGAGASPGYSDLFVYMYKICCGQINGGAGVDLNGYLGLSIHLQKLFKCRYLTGDPTQDLQIKQNYCITKDRLPRGKYTELPRRVEIDGIPEDSKFSIYNSSNYKRFDKLYVVKPGTNMGQNITIVTDKQPRLAYREKRGIDEIIEIRDINNAGVVELSVNRQYTKMHNIFYITVQIGDLTAYEHYGAIRIVAWDGTILTVRVEVFIPRTQLTKKVENKRVYAVGYFPEEITPKLQKIANEVIAHPFINGVKMEMIEPTLDFEEITEAPPEEELEIE